MKRVYNFSAGPACLPEEVLKEAAEEMLDYNGSGMSVMEMSHRSLAFDQIIRTAEQDLRDLMQIPDNYKVLFLQGGEDGGKIAVIFIRLGDVEHAGHVGIFEVFPAALSADGDAVFRSAEDYAGLDGAQGAHHVAREVEKARAVEHVDLAAAEVDRRDAGRDRDLALM